MKPIIFNTAMVRAILDDRKTQTRRPFTFKKCIRDYVKSMGQYYCLKHQNKLHGEYDWSIRERSGVWADYTHQQFLDEYAPYKVGDIIYVRETWSDYPKNYIWFKADFPLHWDAEQTEHGDEVHIEADDVKWKPSIHIPKEYARLFLRVKDVRIERLNEIGEHDAKAEGCWYGVGSGEIDPPCGNDLFQNLWESIYGNGSFDNRYVWVIEFEQISKEEAINEHL